MAKSPQCSVACDLGYQHGSSLHPVLAHLSSSGAAHGAGGNSTMEKPGTTDIYLGRGAALAVATENGMMRWASCSIETVFAGFP